MRTHVIFSHEVGAPAEVILFGRDEELYSQVQEVEEAENTRYAHYYEESFNEYDVIQYKYVETLNA